MTIQGLRETKKTHSQLENGIELKTRTAPLKKSLESLAFVTFIATSCSATAQPLVELDALADKCAPDVAKDTLQALIKTESSMNPLAIAVVGGKVKQPSTLSDALALVKELESQGSNYSLGLGQINVKNFNRLGVTAEEMFEPCKNLQAAQHILKECFLKAQKEDKTEGKQLGDALSCYYSGNEQTGYKGYVQQVVSNADKYASVKIPSIQSVKKELNNRSAVVAVTSAADADSVVIASDHANGGLISSQRANSGLIF